MARKDTVRTQLQAGQSLAAAFFSPATMIRNLDNVSYQINVTTTDSAGTFSVQVSNDYDKTYTGDVDNAGNWANLVLSGIPAVAGTNTVIVVNLNQLPFNAIRLAYTPGTAGTGHADVWLVAKQIGG
jgi:hypothetical protein